MPSRQVLWQRARIARGECKSCGKKREVKKMVFCQACREKCRLRNRINQGYKGNDPRGRPQVNG